MQVSRLVWAVSWCMCCLFADLRTFCAHSYSEQAHPQLGLIHSTACTRKDTRTLERPCQSRRHELDACVQAVRTMKSSRETSHSSLSGSQKPLQLVARHGLEKETRTLQTRKASKMYMR